MKIAHCWMASAALAAALTVVAPSASAQGILSSNTRRMAVTLNLGGSIGVAGPAGVAFRLNPEFHYSFGEGMRGPAIGAGIDMLLPGFGIGASGRFQWNFQPIESVAFLVTPYGGITVGGLFASSPLGSLNLFYFGVHFGGEVRLILADRGFLTLRPLGFTVPILAGEGGGGAGFAYDVALGGGVTF